MLGHLSEPWRIRDQAERTGERKGSTAHDHGQHDGGPFALSKTLIFELTQGLLNTPHGTIGAIERAEEARQTRRDFRDSDSDLN